MKNLEEAELFERLQRRLSDRKITHEEISSPDYEVWGRAREWDLHQAVCLLSGLAPLFKPYFEQLISDQSFIHLINWLSYYPFTPQDRNRLINIHNLLKKISPSLSTILEPKTVIDQCKSHPSIASSLPKKLIEVIEQFGPHPSLNLPNNFRQLEINPAVFINLKKFKENAKKPKTLSSVESPPSLPPTPPPPPEPPLKFCMKLYPFEPSVRWQEADGFSFHEIVLLHYNLNPEGICQSTSFKDPENETAKQFVEYFNSFFYSDFQLLLAQIDEENIGALLHRALQAGSLEASEQGIFSKEKVVEWMHAKKLNFPIQDPETSKATVSLKPNENDKQIVLSYDVKKLRPEQQAKMLCRTVAAYLWKVKKQFKIQEILKHALFKKIIPIIQEIMTKSSPIEPKTIEDWIRDLNPKYKPQK